MKNILKGKTGIVIVTENQAEIRIVKGKKIKIIPAWKWLLENR